MCREAGTTFAAQAGRSDPFAVATMKAANPSWSHMPTLRDGRSRKRRSGPRRPRAYWRVIGRYGLNLGVSDVTRPHLISPEEWLRVEVMRDDLPPASGPQVWGVDMGSTAAMSALAAYWPRRPADLTTFAAFPVTSRVCASVA